MRPTAAEIVRRHAPVVVVAGLVSGSFASAFDPVLDGALRTIDQGFAFVEAVLNEAIDPHLQVAQQPGLAMPPLLVSPLVSFQSTTSGFQAQPSLRREISPGVTSGNSATRRSTC